jgi:hypothetical protein
MTWLEFELVHFDVGARKRRRRSLEDSEKSDAQVETVGCQKERNDQAGLAKHGEDPEHIDVRWGC